MSIETDLIELDKKIVEMEQAGAERSRAEKVREFFESYLSDQLIFRRANGKVVGKRGPDGFLEGLVNNPFSSRESEDFTLKQIGDRALVSFTIVGTMAKDGSVHRYRNIRLFTRAGDDWILEFWYNYEFTQSVVDETTLKCMADSEKLPA